MPARAAAAERAAALEPDAATTEHALGNVARAQFQYADAEQHYLRAMQIDPGYPDVREDYAELLYEVGRLEDSMRAARQLVKLDPYFVVGWSAICVMPRPRSTGATRSRRRCGKCAPSIRATVSGKFGLLDYALAYGRADEARAALAEIDGALAKGRRVCANVVAVGAGRAGRRSSQTARRDRGRTAGRSRRLLIARQDIDGYNADIETRGAILEPTTSSIFTAASRGPRDAARSAGQGNDRALRLPRLLARERLARRMPAASAKQISNAESIRRAENEMNFFAELKRRNVYKVAVAYAVVGWLLVQVATQVFPFFEIPNWAVRLVVLAIVIGFPVALVIAWAFELTPQGIKRTEDADRAAQGQPEISRMDLCRDRWRGVFDRLVFCRSLHRGEYVRAPRHRGGYGVIAGKIDRGFALRKSQ